MQYRLILPLTILLSAPACSSSTPAPPADAAQASTQTPAQTSTAPQEGLPAAPSPYDALPAGVRGLLEQSFTGDFDAMVKRRLIRAGVVFNRTQYFIDRGVQRGMAYDSIRLFEEEVNARIEGSDRRVHVAFVPLSRDELFTALNGGRVDMVAAALTVTPEREKLVSFSKPTRTNVSEVVVTGAGTAPIASADDLSGREIFVRPSSSYHESLVQLNAEFARRQRAPVVIKAAPEPLEDDDLLEMVNAGLVEATVVDDFVAKFWQQVFPDIRVHQQAAVRTGGSIAVAVRKDNPRLRRAITMWIDKYGPRTAFGNIVDRRYLQSTEYVKRASDRAEREKFERLVQLFRKYGDRYNLDYLLMAAQGYQESRLDHNARSRVGAVGIMQVMPDTGKDMRVGDVRQLEPNIHAGVKYVRFMMDEYFENDPMDDLNKALMALASYNAGPARVRQLRQEAAKRGLNPNLWFGNVERIASERVGRETVEYVGNIYKYYVAYRLVVERAEERRRLKTQPGGL
jgi:membrane-bound lytic murein transglycosylase MltF